MSNTVNFQTVTFQGASLCEGFLTKITFVRSNACKAIIQTDYFFAGSLHPVMRGSAWVFVFLPVCVRVCLFRSKVSLNPLPQKVQRYLFTSLWHFICRLRSRCKEKLLSHVLHLNLLGSASHLNTWVKINTQKSSGYYLTGGSLSVSGLTGAASRASGFLSPWPPLMSSSGVSRGMPSWNIIILVKSLYSITIKIPY